jgi:hypothetical protein
MQKIIQKKEENLRIKGFKVSFLALFFLAFSTLATAAQTTVTGTGNPAVDVPAVQNAVDVFDTVYLQGDFDFGTQFVQVSRPDVTLTAQNLGDATITGMLWDQRLDGDPAKDNPHEGMIHVEGDGVTVPTGFTVTNLIFECSSLQYRSNAVSIYNIEDPTNITTIENNIIRNIKGQASGLHTAWVHGKIHIKNNEFSGWRGIFTFPMGGGTAGELLEIGNNTFAGLTWPMVLQLHYMEVDVHHNTIAEGALGVVSNNWSVDQISEDPPYYPRDPMAEPPTTIRNNFFDCYVLAVWLGEGGGISVNHRVIENTITGSALWGGIWMTPFCMYNTITSNDLSGFSSTYEQISVPGVGHKVTHNILGSSAASVYPPVLIYSINEDGGFAVPHDTYGIVVMKNDYRNTDVPGWETGLGCIMIGENFNPNPAFPLRKVRDCLIFEEGRFPEGTGGASKQILDLLPPDGVSENNRIVGHPACYILDPGIGQTMKEVREELMMLMEELEEDIEN